MRSFALADSRVQTGRSPARLTRRSASRTPRPRSLDTGAPVFPLSQHAVFPTFGKACSGAELETLKSRDVRPEATSRICEQLADLRNDVVTPHKTPAMRIHYYQPKAGDLPRKLARRFLYHPYHPTTVCSQTKEEFE